MYLKQHHDILQLTSVYSVPMCLVEVGYTCPCLSLSFIIMASTWSLLLIKDSATLDEVLVPVDDLDEPPPCGDLNRDLSEWAFGRHHNIISFPLYNWYKSTTSLSSWSHLFRSLVPWPGSIYPIARSSSLDRFIHFARPTFMSLTVSNCL